jgi:hypothetical protein
MGLSHPLRGHKLSTLKYLAEILLKNRGLRLRCSDLSLYVYEAVGSLIERYKNAKCLKILLKLVSRRFSFFRKTSVKLLQLIRSIISNNLKQTIKKVATKILIATMRKRHRIKSIPIF